MREKELTFKDGEEKKKAHATIRLPEKMTPGEHKAQIIIEEKGFEKKNSINSLPAVINTIRVRVPYPGKYLEGALAVLNKDPEKNTPIAASVYNAGNEEIMSAKMIIDIYGPTNERITTIKSEVNNIKSKEEKKITAYWPGIKNPGKYYAKAIITYDEEEPLILEKIFELGKPKIEIKDIEFKNFKLGEITKINIKVRNLWNQEIKEAKAKIKILQEGIKIAELESLSADLKPYIETMMEAYWDTEETPPGRYDLLITTEYQGGKEEKEIPVVLQPDSARTINTGMAINEGKENNNNGLITIAIIALTIMNLTLFYYVKKNMKNKS